MADMVSRTIAEIADPQWPAATGLACNCCNADTPAWFADSQRSGSLIHDYSLVRDEAAGSPRARSLPLDAANGLANGFPSREPGVWVGQGAAGAD
jgi:hypothetical protein